MLNCGSAETLVSGAPPKEAKASTSVSHPRFHKFHNGGANLTSGAEDNFSPVL